MKHKTVNTRADRVGQVQIAFTHKQLTAWGGVCSVVAKFLERIGFRDWVLAHVPVQERSPNAKGIYEKVLALLLTSLTGGTRFSHLSWWGHGLEALQGCFGVGWLPQAASVLTRLLGKFRQRDNEALRAAAVGYGWHEFNVHSFWGTEAAMLLVGMVCYNLVHHLNRCVLKTAEAGLARLKTLRLKVLAIPAIYGRGGRQPTLRLGVADGRLQAKIRYWLERIQRLGLRLFNCNAVGLPPGVQA